MKVFAAVILICLLSAITTTQGRPDFSGEWLLASLRRYLASNQPPREYLGVERFRNQSMSTFEITVVSASVLSTVGTERGDVFAAFEGQTLVVQRLTPGPGGDQIVRKEIWSLASNGLLRITTINRLTAGEPVTTEAIYRRPWRLLGSLRPGQAHRFLPSAVVVLRTS